MATQMQLEVILIGEVDWRKSIKLIRRKSKKLGQEWSTGEFALVEESG